MEAVRRQAGLVRYPLKRDTDNGGVPDGREDTNRNGRVDKGETDPTKRDGESRR